MYQPQVVFVFFILECMQHIVELALWLMRLCVLSLIGPIVILPNLMTAKFLSMQLQLSFSQACQPQAKNVLALLYICVPLE